MVAKIITTLLLGITLASPLQARIFITHGFNGAQASWYQPRGDFYEALKENATTHGHSIAHFTWNQSKARGYTLKEQQDGGSCLAKEIIEFCDTYRYNPAYPNDHEIIVIAHSYGGLVSYHASLELEKFLQTLESEKTLATTLYSQFSNTLKNSWQGLVQLLQQARPRPVISKLITLGTPHQETDIVPSSHSILKIYNVYSTNDFVAHATTAGSALLPKKLRSSYANDAYNILLLKDNATSGLGHSEIHHPALAGIFFEFIDSIDSIIINDYEHVKKSRHLTYVIDLQEQSSEYSLENLFKNISQQVLVQ